jgi:hypothetical protein
VRLLAVLRVFGQDFVLTNSKAVFAPNYQTQGKSTLRRHGPDCSLDQRASWHSEIAAQLRMFGKGMHRFSIRRSHEEFMAVVPYSESPGLCN